MEHRSLFHRLLDTHPGSASIGRCSTNNMVRNVRTCALCGSGCGGHSRALSDAERLVMQCRLEAVEEGMDG